MAYPLSFFLWLFVTIFILLLMKKAADKMIYFGDTLEEPFYKELAKNLQSEKKLYFVFFIILLANVPFFIWALFSMLDCI
jgi:hypothetical protein